MDSYFKVNPITLMVCPLICDERDRSTVWDPAQMQIVFLHLVVGNVKSGSKYFLRHVHPLQGLKFHFPAAVSPHSLKFLLTTIVFMY